MGYEEGTDQYMICGEEVGDQEETPHIQGYIQYKERVLGSAVKRRWPTAHIEKAKGSPEQNVTYCSKGGLSHEHGECLKGQGSRSDLDDIKRLIDSNCRLDAIREQHYGSYLRYQNAIIRDRQLSLPNRSWATELHIRWGASGSGKSRWCLDTYPQAVWKTRGEWWDGYDGDETVIIDDFYGWIKFDDLLRIADRYPLQLPVKGGFRKFVAKRVIITSNKHWRDWYPSITYPELWTAFERRITTCMEFRRSADSGFEIITEIDRSSSESLDEMSGLQDVPTGGDD